MVDLVNGLLFLIAQKAFENFFSYALLLAQSRQLRIYYYVQCLGLAIRLQANKRDYPPVDYGVQVMLLILFASGLRCHMSLSLCRKWVCLSALPCGGHMEGENLYAFSIKQLQSKHLERIHKEALWPAVRWRWYTYDSSLWYTCLEVQLSFVGGCHKLYHL